jgi:hypothetical protein
MRQLVVLFLAGCALAQADARAQQMSDPMRPPDAATASGAIVSAARTSGLQAVITSPGRKLALIDGSVVPLGATVKGATLAGVSDSVAVLRKNGDRDVLLMHPNIEKTPARKEGAP